MVVYQGANVSLLCIMFRLIIQNNYNLHLHITMRIKFFFIADHFIAIVRLVMSPVSFQL